jgi:wobble nucleotide-excising tRNase
LGEANVIEAISLVRNIGQFDSASSPPGPALGRIAVVYAENARGKTTLTEILRSLAIQDPDIILARRRLGAINDPHVVIDIGNGTNAIFQNGAWDTAYPNLKIFNDQFVADNVHSGIIVDTQHRQNLHGLILGAAGIALNQDLAQHIAQIEVHNRNLRELSAQLPARVRGPFTVDAFCELDAPDHGFQARVEQARRNVASAQSSEAIATARPVPSLDLPDLDIPGLEVLLQRDLPDLETDAAALVQRHLARLGSSGEQWIDQGLQIRAEAETLEGSCPFCAQALEGSPVLRHYQSYFGDAYRRIGGDVAAALSNLEVMHGGEASAAFERRVSEARTALEFWSRFTEIPPLDLDTEVVARARRALREAFGNLLERKAAQPLERIEIDEGTRASVIAFDEQRLAVEAIRRTLEEAKERIELVREAARESNLSAFEQDLARLEAEGRRFEADVDAQCQEYVDEKAAKMATEAQRDQARAALTNHRDQVFPDYENRVNEYLGRFNADFRLSSFEATNTRSGSRASYQFLINQQEVDPTAQEGPSFRNTLSAGDRNTLALAFFFASLENDPHLADAVVVIDDPMSSLDEHRTLHTIQEIRRLADQVQQILILSHSKPFLFGVWEKVDPFPRSAAQLSRAAVGSAIEVWNVTGDMMTLHDQQQGDAREYLSNPGNVDPRSVAESLRPMLERFMRISYSVHFTAQTMLGQFADLCRQRVAGQNKILNAADTTELRQLLDYANRYHHSTNPAFQTEAINDAELTDFTERTLMLTRRPN